MSEDPIRALIEKLEEDWRSSHPVTLEGSAGGSDRDVRHLLVAAQQRGSVAEAV
jgi:hypothetical protein